MDVYVKRHRAASTTDYESWTQGGVSPTLNAMDNTSDTFATVIVVDEPDVYQCHGSNVGPMGALRAGEGTVQSGVPFVADEQTLAVSVLGDIAHTLTHEGADASEDGTGRGTPIVTSSQYRVRHLTPTECERLQGFPDGHTDVLVPKSKRSAKLVPQSDSQRYKQLGNAVTVDVFHWVGLLLVDADARTERAA